MSTSFPETPGRWELARRALSLRCPVCGADGIFPGWTKMVDSCQHCGFRLNRVEGHWIGAVALNTILSLGVVLAVLLGGLLATMPSPRFAPFAAILVLVGLAAPVALFPWSRTLWSALDLAMTPLEAADFVEPAERASGPR